MNELENILIFLLFLFETVFDLLLIFYFNFLSIDIRVMGVWKIEIENRNRKWKWKINKKNCLPEIGFEPMTSWL